MWVAKTRQQIVARTAEELITRGCNAIIFKNSGSNGVYINGLISIAPKASFTISQCHPDIKDETDYHVKFNDSGTIPPGFDGTEYVNPGNSLEIVTIFITRIKENK